jgi:4-diphosphocytidyl-2-C-methyl-D-erythritol kinase
VTTLRAPAKLTWSLHVTGVRADGRHLLEAEMVTLDLADTLVLEDLGAPDGREPVEARFTVTTEPPASARDAALGDDDLVRRALRLAGRRAHVAVVKRVPLGAGLGGGSADAAAVLRWAGVTDLELAATLGGDVPFCVVGGRASVRGAGEVVEPLVAIERTVTLALPGFGVDTAACYAAFDALDPAERQHPRNDLTVAAERVAPRLAAVRDLVEARAGAAFTLAGSGSTLFCEGDPLGLGTAGSEVVEAADGPVRLLVARTTGPEAGAGGGLAAGA